jgi:hypothetical protein
LLPKGIEGIGQRIRVVGEFFGPVSGDLGLPCSGLDADRVESRRQ